MCGGPCREKHIGDLWFERNADSPECDEAQQRAILEAVGSAIDRLERQMADAAQTAALALELVQQHAHLAEGSAAVWAGTPLLRGEPGDTQPRLIERVEREMRLFRMRQKVTGSD